MINLILCGGSGTRLWPISRTEMPKQFVKIYGNRSLYQQTVERNSKSCESFFIVTNEKQFFLIQDQMDEVDENLKFSTLLEPVGRNTAPAIALACLELDYDDIVFVSPSDHVVRDLKNYNKVLDDAKKLAEAGNLVTFGIKPEYPETGFGYIEADGNNVKSFKEKPTLKVAENYIKQENYYWNSGMFCFKAGVFLDEVKKFNPKMYEKSKAASQSAKKDGFIRINHDDMVDIPADSIDYAVMEKSDKVKVVPADISWSDLGSFDSLYDDYDKDKNGNSIIGDTVLENSHNNLVMSDEKKMITTIDVDDLIIVDTKDALLVANRGSSQKVKNIVDKLKKQGSTLPNEHITTSRPWGTYTILEVRERFKIKEIVVKQGRKLSLQRHFHRSEHWIVVSGTAKVTCGNKEFLIPENESTYIPMGEWHRLENSGKVDLVIIEAQIGNYLEEDDIERKDDDYNRA